MQEPASDSLHGTGWGLIGLAVGLLPSSLRFPHYALVLGGVSGLCFGGALGCFVLSYLRSRARRIEDQKLEAESRDPTHYREVRVVILAVVLLLALLHWPRDRRG